MLRKIFKRLRGLTKDTRGSAAVEFAMVAPAMIAMLYGLMEGGRYYWTQQALDFAVQEGARYASTDTALTNTEIEDYARAKMININQDKVIVTITERSDETTGLSFKAVEATIPFNIYVAADSNLTEISITAKAEMLVLE